MSSLRIRPGLASLSSCLIYPWLSSSDSSIAFVADLKRKLLGISSSSSPGGLDHFMPVSVVREALDIDGTQLNVLLDILSDVSDTGVDVRRLSSSGELELVDVHRLLLLLVIQIHLKQQGKSPDDHWPSNNQSYHHQIEPSSPLKLHAKSFASGSATGAQGAQGVSEERMQHETRRLSEYLAGHVEDILRLISDTDVGVCHPHELARLAFLLSGPVEELRCGSDDVAARVREAFDAAASAAAVVAGDSTGADHVLIQDVHKMTVIRGEEEIAGAESVRIVDCHDSVIYILAPLKWAQVVSCTNSIVVLGAVGQSLRIEYSERLQVVAVSSHTVINTVGIELDRRRRRRRRRRPRRPAACPQSLTRATRYARLPVPRLYRLRRVQQAAANRRRQPVRPAGAV